MQKEITERTEIFDNRGYLLQSGWAWNDFFEYDRSKIKEASV